MDLLVAGSLTSASTNARASNPKATGNELSIPRMPTEKQAMDVGRLCAFWSRFSLSCCLGDHRPSIELCVLWWTLHWQLPSLSRLRESLSLSLSLRTKLHQRWILSIATDGQTELELSRMCLCPFFFVQHLDSSRSSSSERSHSIDQSQWIDGLDASLRVHR